MSKGKVELGETYKREKKLSRKSFVNCSRLLMCNRNYAVQITQNTTNANATNGAIKLIGVMFYCNDVVGGVSLIMVSYSLCLA